jgi:hypothetical protein
MISWVTVVNCGLAWNQFMCEQGSNYLTVGIKIQVLSSQITKCMVFFVL